LLLALIESGLRRDEAYRLVQTDAMRAWDEERDFRALVESDPAITERLDAAAFANVFDLGATVAQLDRIFDRLSAIAPKKEPVHA
jgi:adenylosuccinate lyase